MNRYPYSDRQVGEWHDRMARLEAECSTELPEMSDPTLADRAQRLLATGEEFSDSDQEFLEEMSS